MVNAQEASVKAALAASLGFVIAAAAVAIALIVSSDVRARAAATVAQYSARARVVESFLTTTPSAREESSAATTSVPSAAEPTTRELLMAMSAASGRLRIVTLEGEQSVTAVRTSADGTLELQGSGGWIPLAEVKGFELSRRD